MRYFLPFILTLFSIQLLFGQSEFPHIKGEILVQTTSDCNISELILSLRYEHGLSTEANVKDQVSNQLSIWKISFNPEVITHDQMLSRVKRNKQVIDAQLNYTLKKRLIPNDANYAQQWQYEQASDNDLDAEAAWDITTGGVTALGDTIVVCVIDDGLEVSHPDWGDNIWYNAHEIPGNGIDDDGNGYIDDFRGWNADNNTNDIVASGFFYHGTPVAGIVAAQGNNGVGVSGVNWDVKMMFVVGGGTSSDALAAYDYPLSCRKLYNQTNGLKGAFVVATNASWGIDNQDCASYAPLVNNMYDTLGKYGVLNAAATANANTNVDVAGDFPTSCSSDYLIAVTNMNQTGVKVNSAGYGINTIDLGAFGEGTYTIARPSTYGGFGGTSGATPHVAGAVGLLYSAPCPRLALLARTQPEQTALLIKNILLNSSVPNTSLNGITVSGGVLNLKNALDSVLNIGCSLAGCHEPYNLAVTQLAADTLYARWERVDSTNLYYYGYREVGAPNWITISTPDTTIMITGLTQCTDYETRVSSDCDSADYSNIIPVKTADCCNPPSNVSNNQNNNTNTTAFFSWSHFADANTYTVEFKALSDTVWQSINTTNDSITLFGLDSCTIYELRIISSCNVNINNVYSNPILFETYGCGSCTKSGYCSSAGSNANDDWIETVTIGTINNNTGIDNGYGNFISTGITTDLARGGTYPVSIDIGFNTGPWSTNWRLKVWIDFNQDETFDDSTELAFDAGQITTPTINHTGTITVPASAQLYNTRMRVAMQWGSSLLYPCSNPNYGEVEDYCVNITEFTSTTNAIDRDETSVTIFPNPFNQHFNCQIESKDTKQTQISLFNSIGSTILQINTLCTPGMNQIKIPAGSLPKGVYLATISQDGEIPIVKKIIKN